MTIADSKGRTRNYFLQITGAAFYKAVAMLASFLAVPLMMRYLGEEQFGIWSTLLAVLSWVVLFDLGIGNGLRNKVAELNAKGEMEDAAVYIGSAYTLLGLIAFFLWFIFTITAYWIPWRVVFNTNSLTAEVLRETIFVVAFFLALNFWVGLVAALLGAIQKTSLIALGQLVNNLIVLTAVFILSKFSEASIIFLAYVYGVALVSVNVFLNVYFFWKHPELRPRLCLSKKQINPLLGIGIKFFIIQLAVLVIFTTDKILITQIFGPEYVAQYEVVAKLFGVIIFLHNLISAPLWSAYTDAYHRNDVSWIKRMLRLQLIIFVGIIFVTGILAVSSHFLVRNWISGDFVISNNLVISMSIFVLISIWNNIYAMFLNGVGEIKIQLYTAIVAMFINIPISIFLAKSTELGVAAIVVGTICSLFIGALILPIQVFHTLNLFKSKVIECQ